MDTAASFAAGRSGSLPMTSPSRKEWRAVSELHVVQNLGDEVEFERSKMEQSDERTIYEQQIHNVSRQREELQRMEVELRAQAIARPRILDLQSSCDAKIEAHADATAKLEEQIHESEKTINELKRRMEEKDRELHAIKVEKEEAWAKEDLLREQNKELATFRRERDHSEAERARHRKQIHDLQEHVEEKERQLMELQEQYRAAQETILYKDEQLREVQTWISSVQEMDALQSSTNHSLQAELRERTEQYNQLWHGCQRQFAEMERLHLQTIHQLQFELADARERNSSYTDESHASQAKSKDLSEFGKNNGNQVDSNGSVSTNNAWVISNGASNSVQSFTSDGNSPTEGFPHSVASQVGQYSMPTISSTQQWQNQQISPEDFQLSAQNQVPPSQTDQSFVRSDLKYEYKMSVNEQAISPDRLNHISQGPDINSLISSSAVKAQVLDSIKLSFIVDPQPEPSLEQVSSQFHGALTLGTREQSCESQELIILNMNNHVLEDQVLSAEEASTAASPSPPDSSEHSVNFKGTMTSNGANAIMPEKSVSTGQTNILISAKTSETALLDERSLLACIVRTIPTGGRIRISSTLPNRLGKMLSPLHWHDYKKKYGKLDDFVASHPTLFVIEGDYIWLQEGAQEMIAATAAIAKVAAAAEAPSSYSFLPSVSVTPIAQRNRLKKALRSIDSYHVRENALFKEHAGITKNASNGQQLVMQNQHPNGICVDVSRGFSNVKILSQSKDPSVTSVESMASGHGRSNSNVVGKQQSRTTGAALSSRR
ncbi:hypothetical protein ERO13_D09G181300v2 [Gossypium hirsutum]|uniref:Uncharacterized protein isoform X8 n=1 Tax=Gossypium hirsutum TaxID=3635 RepID=A0ABM3AQR9_GOSHI|nr:uncharacterized protein LOC107890790 isoform X8 [Gossypium hirsutum]KAG4131006.1 hypothetical protein ERO13_D09G181300v2 [Gossypium hirsutum]